MMKVTQNFLAIIICSNVIPNPGLWSTVVSCFWNNLSQYFSLPCVFDFQQDKKGYFHIAKRSFPDLRIEDVWLCLQDFSRVSALLSIVQLRVASPPPGRPRLGVGSMDRRREDSAYFSRTAFLFFFQRSPQLSGNVEQDIVQIYWTFTADFTCAAYGLVLLSLVSSLSFKYHT